ncbi:MAG: serine hydrolase domain-containing protein [Pseudomonadota bacterium]
MTPKFSTARLDRIAPRMSHWVNEGRYAGIAWTIGGAEGEVHSGRVGALAETPLWRIFSMTKPLVSLAAMQLVEDCQIHLHNRIRRWLPEFDAPQVLAPDGALTPAREPIALDHLLSHMSGLSYPFLGDAVARRYIEAGVLADDAQPLRDAVRHAAAQPLAFHPGEAWKYSIATDVLAALLEEIEQASIGDILKARIFDPLGLSETAFHIPASEKPRVVEMRGTPQPPDWPRRGLIEFGNEHRVDDPFFGRGGHGLVSTLDDYAAIARSLLRTAQGAEDGLVAPRTLAMMSANRVPDAHLPLSIRLPFDVEAVGLGGFGFGLGFSTDLGARGRRLLGSPGAFGWSGAADTWFTVDPAGGLYAVFMSQSLDRPGASTDFQTLLHAAVAG